MYLPYFIVGYELSYSCDRRHATCNGSLFRRTNSSDGTEFVVGDGDGNGGRRKRRSPS